MSPGLQYPAGSINNSENNHLSQIQQLQAYSHMASAHQQNNYAGTKKTPLKRQQGSEWESSNNKRQNTGLNRNILSVLEELANPNGEFKIFHSPKQPTGNAWLNQKMHLDKVFKAPSLLPYGESCQFSRSKWMRRRGSQKTWIRPKKDSIPKLRFFKIMAQA